LEREIFWGIALQVAVASDSVGSLTKSTTPGKSADDSYRPPTKARSGLVREAPLRPDGPSSAALSATVPRLAGPVFLRILRGKTLAYGSSIAVFLEQAMLESIF
jgi:hypothetical protein